MRSKQDQEDFRRLLNGLLDYWKPVGQAELIEVELMANHLRDYKTIIRLRATQRGNANMDDIDFASATGTDGAVCEEWRADLPDFDNMEKFQRSESHFLGLYYRAVNTLQRMRLGEAVLSRLKANPNARPGPFLQNELS
jgi:hypothetical protein